MAEAVIGHERLPAYGKNGQEETAVSDGEKLMEMTSGYCQKLLKFPVELVVNSRKLSRALVRTLKQCVAPCFGTGVRLSCLCDIWDSV